MREVIRELLANHRGKTFGTLGGLLFALTIVFFGWLKGLFIIAMVIIGYLVGKRLDDEQSGITELLDRYLPNGPR